MDYSDFSDNSRKKSRRVRSWYLYEQFKALENNQSEAAQKLKDKSYQERILRLELNERRARRRLCDQFGLCQSESKLDRSISNTPSKTILSTSTDNLYESICQLHVDDDVGDACSNEGSQSSKLFEDCKTAHCPDISKENSVESVVEKLKYDDNLTDNIKEDLQSVQRNIAENINLQLETVKENIECIEKYAKICDECKLSEDESFNSINACDCADGKDLMNFKTECKEGVCNLFTVWSKFVDLSYSLMQMSSGNCYNDYSTQILTAVLPYVSPIKFAPSETNLALKNKNKYIKIKSFENDKKRKFYEPAVKFSTHRKIDTYNYLNEKRFSSDSKWYSIENKINEKGARKNNEPRSEPLRSIIKFFDSSKTSEKSTSTIWPDDLKSLSHTTNCKCRNIKKVINSILQLSRCLDIALRDIQNPDF